MQRCGRCVSRCASDRAMVNRPLNYLINGGHIELQPSESGYQQQSTLTLCFTDVINDAKITLKSLEQSALTATDHRSQTSVKNVLPPGEHDRLTLSPSGKSPGRPRILKI